MGSFIDAVNENFIAYAKAAIQQEERALMKDGDNTEWWDQEGDVDDFELDTVDNRQEQEANLIDAMHEYLTLHTTRDMLKLMAANL